MASVSADLTVSRLQHSSKILELLHNLMVALTVSAIALSLGAAFGVLSGRGAFAGMFSAGIIAFITGCLGGTRVQCSGPVAPIAAVMAVIASAALGDYAANPDIFGGMSPRHFLNLVCFLSGGILLLLALFRTGFLITYVPNAVVSGFMTGISLIIWIGQFRVLFGWGKTEALRGGALVNSALVIGTIFITVVTPLLLKRVIADKRVRMIPWSLVAIIVMTAIATVLRLDVSLVSLTAKIPDWHGFVRLVGQQVPDRITVPALWRAFPPALEFALICYLDTLMVSLIIDRMTGEKTRRNKELMAQGVANAAVGFVGGIPGTQASIRSVMMVKEGATMRLAGAMVGVFVILEMLLLQDVLSMIPTAVFTGILLKVGWDVCDRKPIWKFITRQEGAPEPFLFWLMIGTALLTVYNLTLAVALFTGLFYVRQFIHKRRGMRDRLKPDKVPTAYVKAHVTQVLGKIKWKSIKAARLSLKKARKKTALQ